MNGSQLRKLREEYDITQERLAKYMKVTLEELQDWEDETEEPDDAQVQKLAELFQISPDELQVSRERSAQKKIKPKKDTDCNAKKGRKKGKTKKKTKKKTRNKTKVKKEKQTVVKKRRSWPIILFILLLLGGVVAGGGYLYWKYGDEYFIAKKDNYKTADLTGTFTAEDGHGGSASSLALQSDGSFTFTVNSCGAMGSYSGSWKISEKTIQLAASDGSSFSFTINSANQLTYTSDTIGCGPYKNDVFSRGSVDDSNTKKEESEEPSVSALTTGTWSGSHSTLVVSSVNDSTMTFTLSSLNPNASDQIATLSDITGTIDDHKVTFEFSDDGYGNAGSGTIIFDGDQAVFSITKTTINPDAEWAIQDHGTLMK